MKVKFKDGTIKKCAVPVEQKVFRNQEAVGWILMFSLTGENTSAELDTVLTTDNISELVFIPDVSDAETTEETIQLSNYNKISSVVIRYAENVDNSKVEIQLTKGV